MLLRLKFDATVTPSSAGSKPIRFKAGDVLDIDRESGQIKTKNRSIRAPKYQIDELFDANK